MLNNRQEFIAYREDSVKAYAAQTKKIIVCAGTGCVAGGSLHIHAKLNELMAAKGYYYRLYTRQYEDEQTQIVLDKKE